jgi:hypothetical protein
LIEKIAMANESRANSPPTSSPGGGQGAAEPSKSFMYKTLDSTTSSIRLIALQPAETLHAFVQCKLFTVHFGNKPEYEALSYKWGSDAPEHQKTILLDGKNFTIRGNLWDALVDLRYPSTERYLWVDALCINQADVTERNHQLKLMPFIYRRAAMVLVWLGRNPTQPTNCFWQLARRYYWERIWIVQEIGKARRLTVLWGDGCMAWDDFMKRIASDDRNIDTLPMKHSIQRNARYGDGYLLRNLLEVHQDAVCSEPRDKVYGFVGLARDCSGFPLDYGKTMWEIYKDVVCLYRDFPGLLNLSKLLKWTVRGHSMITSADLEAEATANPSIRMSPHSPTVLQIPSRVIGKITYLGPKYDEILTSPEKVAEWESALEQLVLHHNPALKREQSELFLESLEKMHEQTLNSYLCFGRQVSWVVFKQLGRILGKKRKLSSTDFRSDFDDQNVDDGTESEKLQPNYASHTQALLNSQEKSIMSAERSLSDLPPAESAL